MGSPMRNPDVAANAAALHRAITAAAGEAVTFAAVVAQLQVAEARRPAGRC